MPLSSITTSEKYAVASKSAKEMEFFDSTGYSVKQADATEEYFFDSVTKAQEVRQRLINNDTGTADDLMVVCCQTNVLVCEYKDTSNA